MKKKPYFLWYGYRNKCLPSCNGHEYVPALENGCIIDHERKLNTHAVLNLSYSTLPKFHTICNFFFRHFSTTSHSLVVEKIRVFGESHRQSLSNWQFPHTPLTRFVHRAVVRDSEQSVATSLTTRLPGPAPKCYGHQKWRNMTQQCLNTLFNSRAKSKTRNQLSH